MLENLNSLHLLQLVADSSQDMVTIKDLDHRFVFVNQVFANSLNQSKSEIIGKNDLEAGIPKHSVLGSSNGSYCGFWNLENKAIEEKNATAVVEPAIEYQQGDWRRMRTLRQPILDENSSVCLLLVCSSDLTNQYKVEQELASRQKFLQAVLDANSNLVFATDDKGRFVFANRALGKFVGLHPGTLTSQSNHDLGTHYITAKLLADRTSNLSELENHDQEIEKSVQNHEGETRRLRLYQQPIAIRSTAPDHLLSVYSDVTDSHTRLSSINQDQDELAFRNSFLSALNSFTLNLVNGMKLRPLLQYIADEILGLFHADGAFVSMIHESGEHLEMIGHAGFLQNSKNVHHQRGEGMAGMAWESGEVQIIDDYANFAASMKTYAPNVSQGLSIPIIANGITTGVIGITYSKKQKNLLDQIDLLNQFAQMVSVAIDNAKLLESKSQEIVRIEALNRLSQIMFSNSDLDVVLQEIAETVVTVTDAKSCEIFHLEKTKKLRCHARAQTAKTATPTQAIENQTSVESNDELLRRCLESQRMEIIRKNEIEDGISDVTRRSRKSQGIGSSVFLPLTHDNAVWGAMVAHRDQKQSDFDKGQISLIEAISRQASISLHRHGLLRKIEHQAYHDSLTGLTNRLQFEERTKTAVNTATLTNDSFAIVFIDLDGFKAVNDTLGHVAGDQLLCQVSRRLEGVLKNTDCLARMGGDEFAALLDKTSADFNFNEVASRILKTFEPVFDIDGRQLRISASVGISLFPEDGNTVGELLKNADIAMYQAKNTGKNNFQSFNQEIASVYQQRIQTEIELKSALANNEFELYFQPKVCSKSKKVAGVEALIRWNHPQRGIVGPSEFIPIVEESGLIVSIGAWVLEEACRRAAQWQNNGMGGVAVAVNVSSFQFELPEFVDSLIEALRTSGLAPELLELEITESFVLKDIDTAVEKLRKIRKTGVEVSIDDFGTGYSSLMYLDNLPVNKLKIDQSFTRKLSSKNPKSSIVNIIIMMAETFNLKTIAEGVETSQQLELMTDLGVDYIQGYFFSKPIPAKDLAAVIRRINRDAEREQAVDAPIQLKDVG